MLFKVTLLFKALKITLNKETNIIPNGNINQYVGSM